MTDPMLGSEEERSAYKQKIQEMIQQDIEQRKQQRLDEFKRSRESPAVIQGSVGSTADALIQALR